MKKFLENITTLIIVILIVVIIGLTTYFSLEVFNVINPPSKYSLEEAIYSKMNILANGEELGKEEFENKVNSSSSSSDKIIGKPRNVVVVKDGATTPITDTSKIDELEKIQAEKLEILLEEEKLNKENNAEEEKVYVDASRFYYEQLDDNAKKIYDKLKDNMSELKTGNYEADFGKEFNDLLHEPDGSDKLNNSFQLAINALTFDNPNLFYIDVTKMYLTTEITTIAFSKTYRVKIGGNGTNYLSDTFQGENDIHIAESRVEEVKDYLIHETAGKDTEEKIRIVHDYFVDSVEYDISAGENIYNLYGAMVDKVAVCEGYSRAFKYVLDELNIPCIIACGIAKNSRGVAEAHAWNYVFIDNDWYAIDVTWDDPIIIGNGKVTNKIRYNYYLRGANKFFEDHFEDGNIVNKSGFKYPRLSVLDYFNDRPFNK